MTGFKELDETYKYCLWVGIHGHPLWPKCGFTTGRISNKWGFDLYTFC